MSKITLNDDGSLNINFEKIKKISIDHITDVISHRILRSDNLTVHEIDFINGGKCYLSYTATGTIVSCQMTNMNTEANLDENIIILKPRL